jgi:hypothetical protein
MAKKIRVWDGTAWQDVAPSLPYTAIHSAQASMPATGVDGQVWLDTDGTLAGQDFVPLAGGTMTGNLNVPSINSGPIVGRNKILNGDFSIWQRGTSFSGGAGYKADRMFSDVGPSNVISRSTDVPSGQGFTYSYRFVNTEVNCPIRHAIELPAAGSLGVYQVGTTWTFSMWVKTSAPRTFNLYAAFTIGNMGTPEATPVNAVPIGTTSTSWQRFTYTFTIPSGTSLTSSNCFQITPFVTGTGTGVDVFFAGMQLEQGPVATPYHNATPNQQTELAACQRYYERINFGTSNTQNFGLGMPPGSNVFDITYNYKVEKRVPAISLDQANIAVYVTTYGSVSGGTCSLTSGNTMAQCIRYTHTSSPWSGVQTGWIYASSGTGYLGFSAEL